MCPECPRPAARDTSGLRHGLVLRGARHSDGPLVVHPGQDSHHPRIPAPRPP
ncbi:hypothetical protein HMPREF9570_02197 [Cutibacterium acnes HL043PA1]|nr:hypothetical protein HMPREF9570_02197 [Cutibacterium acnes HL043PA1]